MINDFYCDEVLSGNTPVEIVLETEEILAYHHTRPSYEVHIVVIPKRHISSLITLDESDNGTLLDLIKVMKVVSANIVSKYGACKIITNLGEYQDSKHLHWHLIYGERIK